MQIAFPEELPFCTLGRPCPALGQHALTEGHPAQTSVAAVRPANNHAANFGESALQATADSATASDVWVARVSVEKTASSEPS